MCASAIFVVGTSGIPPILNYRSLKSYKLNIFVCLFVFYGISTFLDYLMPNPFLPNK